MDRTNRTITALSPFKTRNHFARHGAIHSQSGLSLSTRLSVPWWEPSTLSDCKHRGVLMRRGGHAANDNEAGTKSHSDMVSS